MTRRTRSPPIGSTTSSDPPPPSCPTPPQLPPPRYCAVIERLPLGVTILSDPPPHSTPPPCLIFVASNIFDRAALQESLKEQVLRQLFNL